jgi:hypothetical protein
VRNMALRRQAEPTEGEVALEGDTSGDDEANEGTEGVLHTTPAHRERGSSTPGSAGSSSLEIKDGVEGEVLRLMQANTSALTSESTRKAAMEAQKLAFDIEREKGQRELDIARVEVKARRAKTEEDREAQLQRKEDREAKLEELRIEAQHAQTRVMMKLMKMIQRKES